MKYIRLVQRMLSGEGVMQILSIILVNFFASYAVAGPSCPSLHRGLQTDANLHLATIIGDEDNRETFPDYAKKRGLELRAVEKKYSATGVFRCGGSSGTANVVHKSNRIALSAHQFFEKGSCRKKLDGDFSSCYFETTPQDGSKPVQYKIKPKTLDLILKCTNGYASEDWAVVDLEKDVANVQPYRVADVNKISTANNGYEDLVGQKMTTIARLNANFKSHPLQTSSLCDGEIGGVQGVLSTDKARREYFVATNCSYGGGNSGGGIFLSSGDVPTLLGVVSGGDGTDYLPFGPDNFAGAALVEGRFHAAITKP